MTQKIKGWPLPLRLKKSQDKGDDENNIFEFR